MLVLVVVKKLYHQVKMRKEIKKLLLQLQKLLQ
jgi:hypothetical protein